MRYPFSGKFLLAKAAISQQRHFSLHSFQHFFHFHVWFMVFVEPPSVCFLRPLHLCFSQTSLSSDDICLKSIVCCLARMAPTLFGRTAFRPSYYSVCLFVNISTAIPLYKYNLQSCIYLSLQQLQTEKQISGNQNYRAKSAADEIIITKEE
ncbi:hypothetical protein P3342_002860 [Pyrenophora teres f. teres]|nr:hypothetical protein P3342_002860 [Pyrenophora teres f. teres]